MKNWARGEVLQKWKKKKSNYKEQGFCFGDKRKKRKSYFSKEKEEMEKIRESWVYSFEREKKEKEQ